MATDFVVDSSSPVSPSKSTLFPFLSGNDTPPRKPKAIGHITKTFSSFSITPTKHNYKPATTGNKGKWVGSNTRTPSITSVDSDLDSSTRPVGKLTLRVINPDPQDSDDEDQDNKDTSSSNHDTRTNIDVTPTNSVITQDAVVGTTSSSTRSNTSGGHDDEYNDAPPTPIPTAAYIEQQQQPSLSTPQQGKSIVIPTSAKGTLVRRQSKTLDEVVPIMNNNPAPATIIKPGLLPPLDLTPFDSSHFLPLSSDARSPYLRLSTTVEPAPAIATPVNATPTTSTLTNTNTSTPLPSSFVMDTRITIDQHSVASFDRNTLTTLPGDHQSISRTTTHQSNFLHSDPMHHHIPATPTTSTSTAHSFLSHVDGGSKYAKASYSLTNNPDALRLYRDMAIKTRDKTVQYTYAKYLLEVAALYDHGRDTKHNKLTLLKHSLGGASQRLRHQRDRHLLLDHHQRPPNAISPSTATSIHSFMTTSTAATQDNSSHRRKKRALEEEGIRWMKRLAKDNMPDAAYTIATWMDGSMYGFSKNSAKSFLLYDVAAKAGIRDAVYKKGLYYESVGDHANALQCIKKASDLGVVHATLKLAKVYLHGELSQRQNMTLALTILHQATNDADESCPEPPYMFGLILTNTYPKADIPSQVVQQYGGILACLPYFERAVQLGYPPAHSTLGSILEHGLYGIRVNYAQCYIHYTEAAKRGDPQGMVGLSRLNNRGCHGPNDPIQPKLAQDESGWLAQREPNEETAFYWCQKAADQESPEAEFLLGWYYEIGLGTPRDHEKAKWYYQKAAAAGNQDAQDRLYQDPFFAPSSLPPPKKDSQQCLLM
ncbi:hypothetical protein BC941DRAFT_501366 [Chlamydoabsidia padenii]|nr:hypothetical protein BC941DRAFT_501366 [Chlamydoabsidia padenii]